ncbi:hypothetical protein BTN50_0561 [Candidatus Enterovibrio altilux]|uniref:Uncharacterized protein n=1 Tax=Candidatus Enterovibrio altilux TaxID=1927128 RepID=A0A291B7U6_9GAMM|nr:hypothetical protein BTN50_0561 [Candidatus Enterovibrio luxaltus]
MVLTTPDNVTQPFVLDERLHPFYQKNKKFGNKVIRII